MRFTTAAALLLSSLARLASSAPAPPEEAQAAYEAVIVGGGPSGLSAASGLARVRRRILLIDSGEYRNGPTRHMHDVLGYDGVTPAYFRWAARQQIGNYSTVTMQNGTVTKIEAAEGNSSFRLTVRGGPGGGMVVRARKVVLATGLRDVLPATPGLRENWGRGIYWCPWCDGHEHADQGLGLLAPLADVAGLVREILTLNRDIVAFVNGTDTAEGQAAATSKEPQWRTYLKLNRVRVENGTIEAIERLANGTAADADPGLPSVAEHDVFRVRLAGGGAVERNAFLGSFKTEQASRVGPDMGVALVGERLAVNETRGQVTNVPGFYAVGDANSNNVANVPHALFSGKRAAVFLHVQLAREDAAALGRRSVDDEVRQLWDRANGRPGDLLYAGASEGAGAFDGERRRA